MDIRPLTDTFAVAPQILPEDMAALRDLGYGTIINNRPDGEVPPELQTEAMRQAAEAAGLRFVVNPVDRSSPLEDILARQSAAMANEPLATLAYCASGTRSAMIWALAAAGQVATDDMFDALERAGYALGHLRPEVEARANQAG